MIEAVEKLIGSSYMLGLIHAEEENPEHKINAADEEIPPVAFEEAMNFLKAKVPMTKAEWLALEPKLRFRAFTVAKLGEAEVVDNAKKILLKALAKGESYASTWEDLKHRIDTDALGIKPGYWENVFRTNTQSAYIAGKLQQYENTNVAAYQLLVIEDSRTSRICRHLLTASGYGMILLKNHTFWKKYGFPPYHFQCRTSIRAVWPAEIGTYGNNIDNPSMKSLTKFKPLSGFGGNPLERGNWWDMTDSMKKLAVKFGIMDEIERERSRLISGASSGGILDKSTEEQDAYAKRAYEEIRKKNAESDIAKVAKSSGLTKEEVAKVRNHLFFAKHNLEKGFVRFDESAEIANAWEALEQGRPSDLDIMMIKHELEELTIMEQYGYSYDKAHLLANRKYPWEYKKKGGYTDDKIQAEISRQLKVLL